VPSESFWLHEASWDSRAEKLEGTVAGLGRRCKELEGDTVVGDEAQRVAGVAPSSSKGPASHRSRRRAPDGSGRSATKEASSSR
jgi:hypothetical protein